MTNTDVIDSLFALRRELVRITVATASIQVSEPALQQLLAYRDRLNAIIQNLVAVDLGNSVADVASVCAAIDASTAQLKSLGATEANILTAIDYTHKALDAVIPALGWIT